MIKTTEGLELNSFILNTQCKRKKLRQNFPTLTLNKEIRTTMTTKSTGDKFQLHLENKTYAKVIGVNTVML